MKIFCAFLLVLPALGVYAKSQPNTSYQHHGLNGYSDNNVAFRTLPVLNTHIQTSVVENPTVNFPSYIPPATISQSCHCLKTFVRPQIRNEIITVPTVDRIVRTVTTPVVETVNVGGGTRLTTFTEASSILPGATGTRSSSEPIQSNALDILNGSSKGLFSNRNSERTFTTVQNMNSLNGTPSSTNGVNVGVIARPSIFTFPNSLARSFQGYSNIFSANSDFSNGQRMNVL